MSEQLVNVKLEGILGKLFGRSWKLAAKSPSEALALINANDPRLLPWIKSNREKYSAYRIICTYEDGHKEEFSNETYLMNRRMKTLRFVPVVTGSGGVVRTLVGAAMVIAGVVLLATGVGEAFAPFLIGAGIGMMLGGIIEMLSPRPNTSGNDKQSKSLTSYYFDGPTNTSTQGVPVPLIYGRIKTGSQAVSASISVDQLVEVQQQ